MQTAMFATTHAAFAALKSSVVRTMGTMGKSTVSASNVMIAFACLCLVVVSAAQAPPPLTQHASTTLGNRSDAAQIRPLLACGEQVSYFSCTAGPSYLCPIATEAGEHQQVLPALVHVHSAELTATETALRRDGKARRHNLQALRRRHLPGPSGCRVRRWC